MGEHIPWNRALQRPCPLGLDDLLAELLRYDPKSRCPPLHVCMHSIFDELRTPAKGGSIREDLFDFSDEELTYLLPEERARLIPAALVQDAHSESQERSSKIAKTRP